MFNIVKKIIYRIIQFFIKIGIGLIKWNNSEVISKENALKELPQTLKQKGFKKVFLITDEKINSLGLCNPFIEELQIRNIDYLLYKDVISNPTISSIEKALEIFNKENFDVIVAVGGGSVIDSAKLLGARYANSKLSLKKMKGYFKIPKRIPYLVAVPTTAGSGSEATIVGVVTNEENHAKYAITSPKLLPHLVVLDPLLTVNLPSFVTATTGMDALTHAIECFIGHANTKKTKSDSLEAIKKIWNNLQVAVFDPLNIEARLAMQEAAYLAGVAFTRGFVGYVHALAHPLSGFYNVPHGLANAVLLPKVLEKYGSSINKDMSILYYELGYTEELTIDEKRKFIIEEIKKINQNINIPNKILNVEEKDLNEMVGRGMKEAHPMYPIPKILNRKDLLDIYKEII